MVWFYFIVVGILDFGFTSLVSNLGRVFSSWVLFGAFALLGFIVLFCDQSG